MASKYKGEYGEDTRAYDVLRDHKRAIRQTGNGLHHSVLNENERKIVGTYDAKHKALEKKKGRVITKK